MPACGIRDNGSRGIVFPEPGPVSKKRSGREVPGRRLQIVAIKQLRFDDSDDLMRSWINDHDLLTHQDVVITAPLRIDHDHLLR